MTTATNTHGVIRELRAAERCTCGRVNPDVRSGREPCGEPMDYCVWCGEASVNFYEVDVCDSCDREPHECDCE